MKEFKCIICGKTFTELSPIHNVRCVCVNCYKKMVAETYEKKKESISIMKLRTLVK